jgi:hypothetical protein
MFEISRTALILFGFRLHWYGLLIAIGVLAAVLLATGREKKFGFKQDTALSVTLIAVPAAIICARIYYVLFSWEYYAAHPQEILNIRQGGLAVYGELGRVGLIRPEDRKIACVKNEAGVLLGGLAEFVVCGNVKFGGAHRVSCSRRKHDNPPNHREVHVHEQQGQEG